MVPWLVLLGLLTLPSAVHGSSNTVWVTCGSTIKLVHDASKSRLHAPEVQYSRGSQQNIATAVPQDDSGQSYWVVHGTLDAPCAPGAPIRKGSPLRLQHSISRRWLHSHRFQSPMSGAQEVSTYGSDTLSDGGDVWAVEWGGKAKHWKQDSVVRLMHKDTSGYLSSSSDLRFGQPIHGHQEVACIPHTNKHTEWFAAEGVYLPRTDRKSAAASGTAKKGAKDSDKDEL